ncbi:hypothetical protein PS421_09255 [Pediococcus pentosaceus]|uniref:acyltransferase n=1 Tax=Pediococcus pentosaceus TaxID=1255 RepID=UPI002F2630F1
MANLEKFFNNNISISEVSGKDTLGNFSSEEFPVVKFNNLLKRIRAESKKTTKLSDEIAIVDKLKNALEELAKELGLEANHFSINNDGPTIVVGSGKGQHYISPTHFENGAYLSSPHYDHELKYGADDLPKIHIGKYTRFGKGASVNAGANIYIGDYVWMAPGSILLRQEHNAYGQPSIGARTVAMTKQPPIHVEDYAWIGKEAIVGWNAQYIGKASIVGARSFINKWVGVYSIVGDHSKILRYMPYKAYFMEYYQPQLTDVLKITDWNEIYREWISFYKNRINSFNKRSFLTDDILDVIKKIKFNEKVLVINPNDPCFLDKLSNQTQVDILVDNSKITPFILQKAEELGFAKVRVRKNSKNKLLPVDDNKKIFGKENGYDYLINGDNGNFTKKYLYRVLKHNGKIIG